MRFRSLSDSIHDDGNVNKIVHISYDKRYIYINLR